MKPSARKREMDAEMDEDEKRALKSGWEVFFPSMSKAGPSKRELSPFSDSETPNKRSDGRASGRFGKAMVEMEKKKDLGLASDGRRDQRRGGPSSTKVKVEDEVKDVRAKETWSCQLCTFANIADHGRCGKPAPG